jgi:hypothetical protein
MFALIEIIFLYIKIINTMSCITNDEHNYNIFFAACYLNDFITAKKMLETTNVNPFISLNSKVTPIGICAFYKYDNILRLILTKRTEWLIVNAGDVRDELKSIMSTYCDKSMISDIICTHMKTVNKTPSQIKIERIIKELCSISESSDMPDDAKLEIQTINMTLSKIVLSNKSNVAILDDVDIVKKFFEQTLQSD